MTMGVEYKLGQKVWACQIEETSKSNHYCWDYNIIEGEIVGIELFPGVSNQYVYDVQFDDSYLEDQTEYQFYTTKEEAIQNRLECLNNQIDTLKFNIKKVKRLIKKYNE